MHDLYNFHFSGFTSIFINGRTASFKNRGIQISSQRWVLRNNRRIIEIKIKLKLSVIHTLLVWDYDANLAE